MKRVIIPPVLELFAYSSAHLDFVFERHREIPEIEKVVEIGPKKHPIVDLVRSIFSVRPNMSCF